MSFAKRGLGAKGFFWEGADRERGRGSDFGCLIRKGGEKGAVELGDGVGIRRWQNLGQDVTAFTDQKFGGG